MTKISHKPDNLVPPTANAPLGQKRYTNFYLTMLILSTVGTTLAITSIVNIPTTIKLYESAPAYAILGLAGYVVTLVAFVALVLLWRKDINGLYLKIGTYATTVLLTIGLMLTGDAALKDIINKVMKEIASQGQTIDGSIITTLATAGFYASLVLGIIISITFGLLWWFAWKNQAKADTEL